MSDNWLRVIATDPTFLPSASRERAALAALSHLAPDAQELSVVFSDEVAFIDAGGNFDSVGCPGCGARLDTEWWSSQMSHAAASRFDQLDCVVPCCLAAVSLNDLDYDWPQGFARWRAEAMNPSRGHLEDFEVASLEAALGVPVRIIWTHY